MQAVPAGVGGTGWPPSGPPGDGGGTTTIGTPTTVTPTIRPRRFFQRVTVSDPTMLPRVVNKLGNDIVALLAAKGARTEVAIEVNADLETGIDENLESRLRANATAHDFPMPEFES